MVGTGARGEMEQGEQSGPIDGFKYKKNDHGTVNKYKVICKICNKEFQFHRSCSSMRLLGRQVQQVVRARPR